MMSGFKYKLLFFSLCLFGITACSQSGIQTVAPVRGKIQQSFSEQAKTRLERIYALSMPLDGFLKRIPLEPGANVHKGQIVAQLEQVPFEQQVKEATGTLDAMKAYFDYQQAKLARREQLGKEGFVSQSTLDQIRSEKKAFLARFAEAEARVAIANYNLQQSTLYSPIDGVVLNRFTQGGEWQLQGNPLLEIGNMKDFEVTSDLLTQDAQRLTVGSPVQFSSIGSEVILTGKVKRINPAGFTKKSSLGVDEQRVKVIMSIDSPEKAHLGVGYRLQAEFLVGSPQMDALIVPRFSVLQDEEGNYYVFKVTAHHELQKQIVQIGITTDREIEIKKGLEVSDTIVAQPTADMQAGMRI